MFIPRRVAAPAVMPVSLAEAKAHLRIDSSDEDAVITGLIAAAVAHLDGYAGILGRCLVAQQWALPLAGWPADRMIALPFPDCSAVTITYQDSAHAGQTLDSALHGAPVEMDAGPLVPIWLESSLPSLSNRPAPVTVSFTAGYGATAADVPAAIRQAILIIVADWFENRGEAVIGARVGVVPLPAGAHALLAPHRALWVL